MIMLRSALVTTCLLLILSLSGTVQAEPAPPATPRSAIPFKQEKQAADTQAYQSLALVVLAGLAAYGIIAGLRRYRAGAGGTLNKARRLHTVEAARLSRRSMLYVIEYQGQELLLAETDHGIQQLSTRPLAAPPAAAGVSNA